MKRWSIWLILTSTNSFLFTLMGPLAKLLGHYSNRLVSTVYTSPLHGLKTMVLIQGDEKTGGFSSYKGGFTTPKDS